MLRKTLLNQALRSVAALGVMLVTAAAQQPPAQPNQAESGRGGRGRGGGGQQALAIQEVKPGLYLITGAGGNTCVRVTSDGLIVMDGKLPGNYDKLMDLIKTVSNQPVKYLINTHHHEDHTGNNAKFVEAKVPIVAQENVKTNLLTYEPAGGKPASPTITYAKDYVIRLGGVEVQLHHYGNAHTSGDSVVYFPDLKVVAVSDEVTTGAPNIDFPGGGSAVEWGPTLGEVLKLDFDTAIMGNGNPITKDDVRAYKVKMDTVVSRATELVKKGVPKDQLMSQLKLDDIGWRLNLNGERLDKFYDELSKAK